MGYQKGGSSLLSQTTETQSIDFCEEFFKKFYRINKDQIYKTKRKIGYMGEEQSILIKITDKKDENTWMWELLKYKNDTDRHYDSDFKSMSDISTKEDIIFHQNSYPTPKRTINNSLKDKDNLFMVSNLEVLTGEENEEFRKIDQKIKNKKILENKKFFNEMLHNIISDINNGTYDINDPNSMRWHSNFVVFKKMYIEEEEGPIEGINKDLAKGYINELMNLQQNYNDEIEKRRKLIGKIVLIKRSNGNKEIWKIDDKIYSYGNKK